MYTLSWHQGGEKNVRQAHNRREAHALGKDSDIDSTRTKNNLIFVDVPICTAYKQIFSEAVQEYNGRVRETRKIKDYYMQVKEQKKQRAYEVVVQIGSVREGFPTQATEALQQYAETWSQRNPNLRLVGAYLHLDEPQGTPHLHLDYIPVAECNRGMRLQNSLTRALGAQGFFTENSRNTAQMQWEQSERNVLRNICSKMDIPLYEQGKGRKQHYTVGEYKERQDAIKKMQEEMAESRREQSAFLNNAFEKQMQQQQFTAQARKRRKTEETRVAELEKRSAELEKRITDRQHMLDVVDKTIMDKVAEEERLQKRNMQAKQELHTLNVREFSTRENLQVLQLQRSAVQAEIRRLQTDYKTAYNAALQAQTIAILRENEGGLEWWAWAKEQAAVVLAEQRTQHIGSEEELLDRWQMEPDELEI